MYMYTHIIYTYIHTHTYKLTHGANSRSVAHVEESLRDPPLRLDKCRDLVINSRVHTCCRFCLMCKIKNWGFV